MKIKDEHLIALRKALFRAKFGISVDDEISEIAASGIIREIFSNIDDELNKTRFKVPRLFIEDYPDKLQIIELVIMNLSGWDKLDYVVKSEVLRNVLYPFDCHDETFDRLGKIKSKLKANENNIS